MKQLAIALVAGIIFACEVWRVQPAEIEIYPQSGRWS